MINPKEQFGAWDLIFDIYPVTLKSKQEKQDQMATIIDGRKVSADIKSEIKAQVDELKSKGKRAPHLAIIIVGDDGASHTYVDGKVKACAAVGFEYTLMQFAESISEEKLLKHVHNLNSDDDIDGFIVQLPLPEHISVDKVTESISAEKDVDGFVNENFGSITSDHPKLMPATPFGVIELLKRYKIETEGKNCVIVGASRLVGAPLALMLSKGGNATVTLCNKYTVDLANHTRQADILISAVGLPGLITKDMVKRDAVVIDVGTTRVEDTSKKSGFRLSGDVDYETVESIASHITPVPGGVGPMTIASLMINTLQAAKKNLL